MQSHQLSSSICHCGKSSHDSKATTPVIYNGSKRVVSLPSRCTLTTFRHFSLSETCPGATETLLFVDSMYLAAFLATWLEKHLRKLLRRAWDPNS